MLQVKHESVTVRLLRKYYIWIITKVLHLDYYKSITVGLLQKCYSEIGMVTLQTAYLLGVGYSTVLC